jgi:hypothetical protein
MPVPTSGSGASVHVRQTPNPNARKFVLPGVRFSAPTSFPSAESARNDPLAARLFALEGVYNVFMVQDFVTVNKRPDVPWEPLESQVQAILSDHFGIEIAEANCGSAA